MPAGVACQESRIIGAIVLTVDDEPDAALSYWQLSRRAGCRAMCRTMCYDAVLDEALQPHECLVDFLAVSPEARGKGVGALLMQWAERTAAEILSQRVPAEVAAHGGLLMTLWVAADNDVALRLYARQGYHITKRTGQAPWACLSSRVFTAFLGHPHWNKMSKAVTMAPVKLQGSPKPGKASLTLQAYAGRATEPPKREVMELSGAAEKAVAAARESEAVHSSVVVSPPAMAVGRQGAEVWGNNEE